MQTLKSVSITAASIAEKLGGVLYGDGSIVVNTLTSLDEATEGAVAFIRERSSSRIAEALLSSSASVLLVDAASAIPQIPKNKAVIAVKDPLNSLIKCLPAFVAAHPVSPGVSAKAEVDVSAKLGVNVSVGAFCVVGSNVTIGDDVVLHPHVVLYAGVTIGSRSVLHSNAVVREDCEIGEDTIIQNGSVIGADGFGYIPDAKLGLVAVPQIGRALLEDRVEVGANSCVDRATFGTTRIGYGTKIDNHVQIGHNVKIGKHCLLCGQVGIAGSATIGDHVVLGGNAGVVDHVQIGDNTRFAAKSVVSTTTLAAGDYGGYPIMPLQDWKRSATVFRRLPELSKNVRMLNCRAVEIKVENEDNAET